MRQGSAKGGYDMMVAIPGQQSMQVYNNELDKIR